MGGSMVVSCAIMTLAYALWDRQLSHAEKYVSDVILRRAVKAAKRAQKPPLNGDGGTKKDTESREDLRL